MSIPLVLRRVATAIWDVWMVVVIFIVFFLTPVFWWVFLLYLLSFAAIERIRNHGK